MLTEKKHTTLSIFLINLFEELNKQKCKYCVCGNYIELPYYTENDVDIWTDDPHELVGIIEKICSKLESKIYLKNTNVTGTNLFIYSGEPQNLDIIHIDILKECRWHSFLPLVKSDAIESRRQLYGNFYVANEIVDAAMHLMYPLSHFGCVKTKYRHDIERAAESDTFWKIIEDGWGEAFSRNIRPLIEHRKWQRLEEVFASNRKKLTYRSIRKMGWNELKSIYTFILCNIKRLINPNGLFIAFVGPDGCGKTTIQNKLEPFFEKGFTKGKIKRLYWRPFLLPRIRTLFSVNKRFKLEPDSQDPSKRLELRNAGYMKRILHSLKLSYYWLDYIFGRISYQGKWSRGGVVCFDRYWDDLIVFPERFGLNVSKKLVRLLGVFVPEPDIVFYLHAEPEVLISRKPELPYHEIKRQVDYYIGLSRSKKNYELIDGNQTENSVLLAVISACIKKMAQRYVEKK